MYNISNCGRGGEASAHAVNRFDAAFVRTLCLPDPSYT